METSDPRPDSAYSNGIKILDQTSAHLSPTHDSKTLRFTRKGQV